MKLKEFMANTIPRTRKSKKKQPAPLLPLNNNAQASKRKDNTELSRTYFLPEDFKCVVEKTLQLDKNELHNKNFNINCPDYKCGCHRHTHLSPCCSPRFDLDRFADFTEDRIFNTVPRVRSRIKTNPWLPSPRSSPVPSAPTSPMTSPACSDAECKSPLFARHGDSLSTRRQLPFEEFYPMNFQRDARGRRRERRDSTDSTESSEADPMQRSYTSTDTDSSLTANEKVFRETCAGNAFLSPNTATRARTDIDINRNKNVESRKTTVREIQSPVSFAYEEEFESQLEGSSAAEVFGSNEKIWDADCNIDNSLPGGKRKNVCSLNAIDESGDSDDTVCLEGPDSPESDLSDNDQCDTRSIREGARVEGVNDTVKRVGEPAHAQKEIEPDTEPIVVRRRIREKRTETGGLSRSFKRRSRSLDEIAVSIELQRRAEFDHTLMGDSLDSAYASGSYDEDEPHHRYIMDRRTSLQDKIHRLREEKEIVNVIVRKARDEEKLKAEERLKYQKQLTLMRKQVLLKTLQDLKVKLESQSERLQKAYDTVLAKQWEHARERRRAQFLRKLSTSTSVTPEVHVIIPQTTL